MKNIIVVLFLFCAAPMFAQQNFEIKKQGKDSLKISVTRYTVNKPGQIEGYFSETTYHLRDSAIYAPILFAAQQQYTEDAAKAQADAAAKAASKKAIGDFAKKEKLRIAADVGAEKPKPPTPQPDPIGPGSPGRRQPKKKN